MPKLSQEEIGDIHRNVHGLILRRERDALRERWFGSDEGLLYFAWEAVLTKDEHDGTDKRLPQEFYLVDHLRNFVRERTYFILKSRQILITWSTFIGLIWETLRYRYCNIGLIPKKDEDGDTHIEDRIRNTIWPSLPEWLRKDYDLALTKGLFHLKTQRGVPGRWDSRIMSFAKGAHQLRQHTLSRIFWDEMAYQELARKSWMAAIPTIGSRKGKEGRIIAASTMVPGSFHDTLMTGKSGNMVDNAIAIALGLAECDSTGFYKSPAPGICHYRNNAYGAFCAVYSFYADSTKRDPQWEAHDSIRMGGVDSPEWQLDYRMQREAFRGLLVYPHFNVAWNVVPARKVDPECEIFLSFDFGHTNPTAVLFWEWNAPARTLTCFSELYFSTIEPGDMKQLIRIELATHLNLALEDVVFSEVLGDNVGDPAGPSYMASYGVEPNPLIIRGNPPPTPGGNSWRINAPGSIGENRLDSALRPSFICCGHRQYADYGKMIGTCAGSRAVDGAPVKCGKEYKATPMLTIMEGRAPNLVKEFPLQQRRDPGDPSLEAPEKSNRNIPNHATDSAKYAVMRYPDFLAIEPGQEPIPAFLRRPMTKLTTNEAFWRERHNLIEKSVETREAFEETGEIGYSDDDVGEEDSPLPIQYDEHGVPSHRLF